MAPARLDNRQVTGTADALWLRQMALDHYGVIPHVAMPAAHRVALEKVEWPVVRSLAKPEIKLEIEVVAHLGSSTA